MKTHFINEKGYEALKNDDFDGFIYEREITHRDIEYHKNVANQMKLKSSPNNIYFPFPI